MLESMATAAAPGPMTNNGISSRSVVAAVLGNVLEFYDFVTYAFFAVIIGRQFFPAQSPLVSLLLSVATFGVGFITRPLGGFLIGAYGDRSGRKPAMLLTIALMGAGMLILALTPSYASIGMAAPALVVLARLIQGFALGGEVGPATSFLIEGSPAAQRGYYGSWQLASQGLATLIAGVIGVAVSAALTPEAMEAWGWRIPFLLGTAVIPVGLYIRKHMPETLDQNAATTHHSVVEVFSWLLTEHLRPVVLALLAIMAGTIATYICNYMTTYAMTTLHMPPGVSIAATLFVGLSTLVFSLAGGWLADRIGRKPLMIIPRLGLVAVAYPAFRVIAGTHTAAALLLMAALLAALNAISSAVALVVIPESLPKSVRSAGLSVAYATSVTVFGGTTQFVVTALIGATGNPLSPSWYMIGSSLIGVVALIMMPETK
ncbi:MAG: MFS transporter, partial [Acetobacteraceae bacterium]|nr:MFS transporter [Acetobacteraceae bacterium]